MIKRFEIAPTVFILSFQNLYQTNFLVGSSSIKMADWPTVTFSALYSTETQTNKTSVPYVTIMIYKHALCFDVGDLYANFIVIIYKIHTVGTSVTGCCRIRLRCCKCNGASGDWREIPAFGKPQIGRKFLATDLRGLDTNSWHWCSWTSWTEDLSCESPRQFGR